MRKLLTYLLTVLTAAVFTACGDDIPDTPAHYGRTVLVYMAMQNSLGSQGYHKGDSAEIANAMQYIPTGDRLLLFIDDAKMPRIYEFSRQLIGKDGKGRPELLKRWATDLNSASASTLSEVLSFVRSNYPSDSYGLVLGSHANGWLPMETKLAYSPRRTFGIDVGPDGSMSGDKGVAGTVPSQLLITDIAQAVRTSGVHLDYLFLDACLMSCIEVAYDLRNTADYVISSPLSVSAEGAYYTDLVHYGLFSSDARDIARTYYDYYNHQGSVPCQSGDYGIVLSCIRTAGLNSFAVTVADLLDELCGSTAEEKMARLKATDFSNALLYQRYRKEMYYRPHYYDLVSIFQTLGADDGQMARLNDALTDILAGKYATPSFIIDPMSSSKALRPDGNWCGISMFVPHNIYTRNISACPWGDLNETYKTTEWYRLVY